MNLQHQSAADAPLSTMAVGGVPGQNPSFRVAAMTVAMALFGVALYCRWRLLAVPLERDEGGFAYIAQQMLNGIPPFDSGYSMKLMGIHAVYALAMAIFGQTSTAIHAGLLVANIASMVLLYFLARRFLPLEWAAISAAVYALLAVSKDVMGVFAHATHFVMVFALAGLLAFFVWRENGNRLPLLISGLGMGMAIIMKQNGLFFGLFVFAMLVRELCCRKKAIAAAAGDMAIWTAGLVAPYACILVYVAINGVLAPFWFWTVTFSFAYATGPVFAEALVYLQYGLREATSSTLPLWLLAMIGLVQLFSKGTAAHHRWFPLLFLAVSLLAMIPGGYFYPHYFVLLLPALSMLVGIALATTSRIFCRFTSGGAASLLALAIMVIAGDMVVNTGKEYLLKLTPLQVSKLVYGANPFAESSMTIAQYIQANSTPADKMAILGSEPQIYFYARRQSASKQIFVYSMTDDSPFAATLQREMLAEIKATSPKFIVVSMQPSSWNVRPEYIPAYLQPFKLFVEQQYSLVGVVDMLPNGKVNYHWVAEGERVAPLTDFPIYLLQRNG